MRPLVSVFCPTYNQEDFVGEALESILAQDYQPLEILVPDDGSEDGTIGIVEGYVSRHPGMIRLIRGPHVGITGNCNRGLTAARGEFVAFTAGDDLLLPGKISRQVSWFLEDDARVLCGHDVEVFDSESGSTLFRWSDYQPLRSGTGAEEAVRLAPFSGTSIMVRRSAIPPGGYDDRLAFISDWKLWVDCLQPGGVFGYVDGVLARYRRHSRNVTNLTDRRHADRLFGEIMMMLSLIELEHPSLAGACERTRAYSALNRAKVEWARGDRQRARVLLRFALRASPAEAIAEMMRTATRVAARRLRRG